VNWSALPWFALSYLVGAIPSSLIVGKLFKGIDLRQHGSKNLGATNVYRVLGWTYAIPVTPLDIAKGTIPVLFFAICLALYVTGFVTPLQESLALGFVMLRTVHSFVHTTYNRVTDRFLAYAVSTLFVFAMWGLFALDLAR
jgi:glycerol-3-phosphate acyltransferase PlsY